MSRLESVVLSLRDLILSGELPPGGKVTETGLAERLGVSRTPVRLALQVLESERLVSGEPNRGFMVRPITLQDVLSGFDVRGVLEGLACRLLAEAGMRRGVETQLKSCIERGDAACAAGTLDEDTARTWTQLNTEFHRVIIDATENQSLAAAHDLVCRHPLVGPASMAFSRSRLDADFARIAASQNQHRMIFEAIRDGQGARAEYLAREHIHQARENTARTLKTQATPHPKDAVGMPT